jgi:hypothetical protein
MSNSFAVQWAMRQQTSSQAEWCVLVILASHCNSKSADANLCFPGQETIAAIGRCSVDTVQRALKRLARGGFIEIEKGTDGNGQRRYDRYRLRFETPLRTVSKATTASASKAANCGPEHAAECGPTDTANCGAIHTANQAANHTANHAADCGPNLKEPIELKGARAGACEASASPARAQSWSDWKPGQSVIVRRTDPQWPLWMRHLPAHEVEACHDADAIEVSAPWPGRNSRLLRVIRTPQASEEPSVIRMNGHSHG